MEKSMDAVEEYLWVARFYDRMMKHVNYGAWSRYVIRMFDLAQRDIREIADLSCGTGRHLHYFVKAGYRCLGADISMPMLRVAAGRPTVINRLWQQDVRHPALKENCQDAVIMLFDSVNYLRREEEVARLFKEVARILRPGGLFVFDTVTEYMIQLRMEEYFETETWDDLAYERRSAYDARTQIQYNYFSILRGDRMIKETHRQRIWSHREMVGFIKNSPLVLLDARADFKKKAVKPGTERIHYILLKPKA